MQLVLLESGTFKCVFFICPQNQTPLPASAIRLADVTTHPCRQPETSGKVQQDQKKTRGFPEGKSPLDPLSISPVKPKRNQKERERYLYHKPATCWVVFFFFLFLQKVIACAYVIPL